MDGLANHGQQPDRVLGHDNILAAVLDDLLDAQLVAATSIVLSGESAGGVGVWPNAGGEIVPKRACLRRRRTDRYDFDQLFNFFFKKKLKSIILC